jgi:hypothetical protein
MECRSFFCRSTRRKAIEPQITQNSAMCFAKLSLTESSIYLKSKTQADVAKLVDARDLKSLGLGHAGSIPAVRTKRSKY